LIGEILRLASRHGDGLTDGQLLERYAQAGDEAAFETLLWRHGPMVLGVCRRVLGDRHEAEDAFQATFLVLHRKAKSFGAHDPVGNWLYKVAYRIALRAKRNAAQRPVCAGHPFDRPDPEPSSALVWHDLRPVLDEELNRLPEKYRSPLVLCYLEGKTVVQAAQELGWPSGTVSGRLARAK